MELEGYSFVVLDRLEGIDQHGDRQYMSCSMGMGRVHTALCRLRRDSAPCCKRDDPISGGTSTLDLKMRKGRCPRVKMTETRRK